MLNILCKQIYPRPVANFPIKLDGSSDADRDAIKRDFVVTMSSATAEKLSLNATEGANIAIVRCPPPFQKQASLKPLLLEQGSERTLPLRACAKLLLDEQMEWGGVRMDQTLHTALGIAYVPGVEIRDDLVFLNFDETGPERFHGWFVRLLGVRHVYARVHKAEPADIEKSICRVAKDTLSIIGTSEGSRIVLLSCSRSVDAPCVQTRISVKAFDLPDALVKARAEKSGDFQKRGWDARYVNSTELLGIQPDLVPIYLDAHGRAALGVDPGDAVKIRRDFGDLLRQQILDVGVVLALSTLALVQLFPANWKTCNYWLFLCAAISLSALNTLLIVVLRLRARVT